MIKKYITLENLQHYHKTLMKYLSENNKLIPSNICSRCGGLINQDNICEYCGTKYKLVIKEN